jgi:hypothetical protein
MEKNKILNWTVAVIPRVSPTLNFFGNSFEIFYIQVILSLPYFQIIYCCLLIMHVLHSGDESWTKNKNKRQAARALGQQ